MPIFVLKLLALIIPPKNKANRNLIADATTRRNFYGRRNCGEVC